MNGNAKQHGNGYRKKRMKQEMMQMKSLLIKDTTKEEREEIVRKSLNCGAGGCENCSSCWLGGGDPWGMFQDYIDGKKEIAQINMEYHRGLVH